MSAKLYCKNTLYILGLIVCLLLSSCRQADKPPVSWGKERLSLSDVNLQTNILFHGSSNKNIAVFTPQAIATRDKQEGDVVFATPYLEYAAAFMASHERNRDFGMQLGSFDNGPVYVIIRNKDAFMKADRGGAIYFLPAYDFYFDLAFFNLTRSQWNNTVKQEFYGPMREWVSKKDVSPLYKIEFNSVFQALLDLGAQVYFVNDAEYEKVNDLLKTKDRSQQQSYFMSLLSENKKLNKNYRPLFVV